MIKWDELKRSDSALISKIVKRFILTAKKNGDRIDGSNKQCLKMDITAAHLCKPLRLKEWLKADDFNFFHDVFGIHRHINRNTGSMNNCFLPRFTI